MDDFKIVSGFYIFFGYPLILILLFISLGIKTEKIYFINSMPSRKEILFVSTFIFCLIIFIGVEFQKNINTSKLSQDAINMDSPSKNKIVPQTETQKLNLKGDIEKFAKFHKDAIGSIIPVELHIKKLKNKKDQYKVYQWALILENLTSRSYKIEKPNIISEKAKEAVENAYDSYKDYIYYMKYVAKFIQKSSDDSDYKPSTMQNIEEHIMSAYESFEKMNIAILVCYTILGVDIDKVDIKNGGIKEDNTHRVPTDKELTEKTKRKK